MFSAMQVEQVKPDDEVVDGLYLQLVIDKDNAYFARVERGKEPWPDDEGCTGKWSHPMTFGSWEMVFGIARTCGTFRADVAAPLGSKFRVLFWRTFKGAADDCLAKARMHGKR
jgi:hypothetical protein